MTGSGASPLDSLTLTTFFGNSEMRSLFSDESLIGSWLAVEAALARAQSDLGLIPVEAAEAIRRAADPQRLQLAEIWARAEETGHPLMPLIRALIAACPADAGRYVHLGATTQDVMDTGYVLCMRDGLDAVGRQLEALTRRIRRLAVRHRDTVMPARTHGQQALPTTFGLRCAVWQSELDRHRDRLNQMRARLLVASMGGAAGTMAGYGRHAFALERALADQLGLAVAETPWHSAPDRLAECVTAFGLLSATTEKLAREIYFMGRTEIGEAREPQGALQVGSTTMPHKRNPIRCEAVIAASTLLRAHVPVATQAMIVQDDRDMGAGMTLWKLVPEVFVLIGGALERLVEVFGDLEVDPERMRANLDATNGLILSEAVMLSLAEHLGRERAHSLTMELTRESVAKGVPFLKLLKGHPSVATLIPAEELDALLDPASYLGRSHELVDRALAKRPPRPGQGPQPLLNRTETTR